MDLAKSSDAETCQIMKGYQLFGVVKEIGVDDAGLKEFYNEHFTYPLTKDVGLVFYKDFFGNRKIKLTTFNPIKLFKGYQDMKKRLNEQKLQGNYAGEGMVQGGIVIFDKDGNVRYAYEEETGTPIDIKDITTALKAIQTDK